METMLTSKPSSTSLDRLPDDRRQARGCHREVGTEVSGVRRSVVVAIMAAVMAIPPMLPVAAETVRFRSASLPPTSLQQRLAQESGQAIREVPGDEITGEFYRPPGDEPFPAVVSLHGCAGRSQPETEKASGARYVALGYAVLMVDSFGPRGISHRCGGEIGPTIDRVMDAYGALLYLAGLPFVDPDRIAVIGFSQGAEVALAAVALGGIETLFERHFRAAIAYYPWCGSSTGAVIVPSLILVGELDDWTPARYCADIMTRRSGEGAPLRLVIYPGAFHAFNAERLRGKPETLFGHHLEYDEMADRAAWEETIAALHSAFER